MISADTFRTNLHRAAGALGLNDHNQIAEKLGWKHNDKRWLKRIWERGLDRPDHRRADHLDRLARLIGVLPQALWEPDIEIRGTDVVHDPHRWQELVRSVIATYLQFQRVKKVKRDLAIRALNRFGGDEESLIAALVGLQHGVDSPKLERINLEEMRVLRQNSPEWRALANDLNEGADAIYEIVVSAIQSHQWFKLFVEEIVSTHNSNADVEIKKLIRQIQQRPRTPDEVATEFIDLHLDAFTEDDGFGEAMSLIEKELRYLWRITSEKGNVNPRAFGEMVKSMLNGRTGDLPSG